MHPTEILAPTSPCRRIVAAAVVLCTLAATGCAAQIPGTAVAAEPAATATTTARTTAPSTTAAPPASPTPPELPSARPALRDVPPVSMLGPIWQPGDATYTMALRGWPFAFRTGRSWGCRKGIADAFPDAHAWLCFDERNRESGQEIHLLLRPCPDGCSPSTRSRYERAWFDGAEPTGSLDPLTSYVEIPSDDEGRYAVDLSRFFSSTHSGVPDLQIAVYAVSPHPTRDVVLATVNDIVTQTQ